MATKQPGGKSAKGASRRASSRPEQPSHPQPAQEALVPSNVAVTPGSTTLVALHDEDVLSNLTGSCYKIVGSPINLEVCYSYDGSTQTVCVNVKLVGETIGSGCLSAANPSLKFHATVGVAKAQIELTFDPATLCLSFEAKACYYVPFKWHCASYSGTIACFS